MKIVYVGDFGAGNTCLYCVVPSAEKPDPEALNDANGEPSGYAFDRNGDILLGMGLYGLDYDQLSNIKKFRINLKSQPTAETKDELIFYFRSWLDKMKKDHPSRFIDADDSCWLIGCPTGNDWKKAETIELYRNIFEQADFGKVYIVPESNAALAYYQQTQGVLDDYDKGNTSLLLLDQGAYSLDATVYGGALSSFGSYLGASIIERMMLRMVLYGKEEENRVNKNIHNLPDVLTEVRRIYENEGSDGKMHTYLLLKARELKEDFFSQERLGKLNRKWDIVGNTYYVSEQGNEFHLFINDRMMHKILYELSVKDALGTEFSALAPEVRQELGNLCWIDAFNQFLLKLDSHFPLLSGTGKKLKIMLTGGGSLMKCVAEAVAAHYPEANVFDSSKAISAIGMGMAYWAPDKIRAEEFSDAFEEFTNRTIVDDDGDTVNVISHELLQVIGECVSNMAVAMRDQEANVVASCIVRWRDDYSIPSSRIPGDIDKFMREWCVQTGIPEFEKEIDEHIEQLKEKLNLAFNQVLDKFGIDREKLLKPDDQIFLSNTKQVLPAVFSSMIDIITDHYKGNEIWSKFPTQKKGLFSNPRVDFCNGVAENLSEWIKNEVSSTVDLCFKFITESKFNISDNEYSLLQIFQIEALIDLQNLMKKRKKEILGRLVLEEYLDDDDD